MTPSPLPLKIDVTKYKLTFREIFFWCHKIFCFSHLDTACQPALTTIWHQLTSYRNERCCFAIEVRQKHIKVFWHSNCLGSVAGISVGLSIFPEGILPNSFKGRRSYVAFLLSIGVQGWKDKRIVFVCWYGAYWQCLNGHSLPGN